MQIGRTNRSRLVRPDFLVALAFCILFLLYHFYPSDRLLYHLLYHFCIDLYQIPWGFIEIWFFLDIEKALYCKDLLSYMSLY